ncbi:MAG: hypothetical protein EOM54_13510 [Clostridia bacterium]|nr:hypothetical protein [Clostridia bacterium]
MNARSLIFLRLVESRPVTDDEAYAFFGGKAEFLSACDRHFTSYVRYASDGRHVELTPDGKDFLESEDEAQKLQQAQVDQRLSDQAQRVRDRQKQFRHDWRLVAVSALISSASTLIIEHFQVILAFLCKVVFHH